MLTRTLRSLEREGIVARVVLATTPVTAEYSLTGLGRSMLQPLAAPAEWAVVNHGRLATAREHYDGRETVA